MLAIGDIINSSLGQSSISEARLAADFDDFLILLTAQLQAQDPLDPLDSNEFTSQLIQFTGVEQAIQSNKNLENLTALTAFNGVSASVGYIGKIITVQQPTSSLVNGSANWIYELSNEAFRNQLTIEDSSGDVIRVLDGSTDAGNHQLTWDGLDDFGQTVPDGQYVLKVKATDINSNSIPATIFMEGTVQGIEFNGGESLLVVNDLRIPLTNILAVRAAEGPAL